MCDLSFSLTGFPLFTSFFLLGPAWLLDALLVPLLLLLFALTTGGLRAASRNDAGGCFFTLCFLAFFLCWDFSTGTCFTGVGCLDPGCCFAGAGSAFFSFFAACFCSGCCCCGCSFLGCNDEWFKKRKMVFRIKYPPSSGAFPKKKVW